MVWLGTSLCTFYNFSRGILITWVMSLACFLRIGLLIRAGIKGRERESVWCCWSYIYSVHRWIVLISYYVVYSNPLSTLTERICVSINEVEDIALTIFLVFCISVLELWRSGEAAAERMGFLHGFSYGCHRH